MGIVLAGGIGGYLLGHLASRDNRKDWKANTNSLVDYFSADKDDGRLIYRKRGMYHFQPIAAALGYIHEEKLQQKLNHPFSSAGRISCP
jgi:hypothetical protein